MLSDQSLIFIFLIQVAFILLNNLWIINRKADIVLHYKIPWTKFTAAAKCGEITKLSNKTKSTPSNIIPKVSSVPNWSSHRLV